MVPTDTLVSAIATDEQEQRETGGFLTSQPNRPTTGGVKRVDAFNMKPRPS